MVPPPVISPVSGRRTQRARRRSVDPVTIACFGEALWDVLPRGIFLGGAPLNVAYHLSRHGIRPLPVSAVGRDFLGDEIIRRLEAWGMPSHGIGRMTHGATGTVRAVLDRRGIARFAIGNEVAWDHIPSPRALRGMQAPEAIVYGTLALRSPNNRRVLAGLLAAWPSAWRVLDLNLRHPFDRGTVADDALAEAQFVKLNDEELARTSRMPTRTVAHIESAARRFATLHRVSYVCVTAGARGAGLLWKNDWFWERGHAIAVRDTIGAGDSFLAAFLAAHFARSESPPMALAAACRMGEFVAARDGATPPYRCDQRGHPREVESGRRRGHAKNRTIQTS